VTAPACQPFRRFAEFCGGLAGLRGDFLRQGVTARYIGAG